jgi:hypothetical protein
VHEKTCIILVGKPKMEDDLRGLDVDGDNTDVTLWPRDV